MLPRAMRSKIIVVNSDFVFALRMMPRADQRRLRGLVPETMKIMARLLWRQVVVRNSI